MVEAARRAQCKAVGRVSCGTGGRSDNQSVAAGLSPRGWTRPLHGCRTTHLDELRIHLERDPSVAGANIRFLDRRVAVREPAEAIRSSSSRRAGRLALRPASHPVELEGVPGHSLGAFLIPSRCHGCAGWAARSVFPSHPATAITIGDRQGAFRYTVWRGRVSGDWGRVARQMVVPNNSLLPDHQ